LLTTVPAKEGFLRHPSPIEFEMTRCNQCGSEMLMGADVCPSCGKQQSRRGGAYQPQTLLAIGLTAAVLLFFSWMKTPPTHTEQVNPPSAIGTR
jgi:hypothetical protein